MDNRYDLIFGKFGQYFYDNKTKENLILEDVVNLLNDGEKKRIESKAQKKGAYMTYEELFDLEIGNGLGCGDVYFTRVPGGWVVYRWDMLNDDTKDVGTYIPEPGMKAKRRQDEDLING